MSVRRLITGAATASLVAASVAIAAPASADPSFVPVATDYVGVGSDTSMFALNYLADGKDGIAGFNAGRTAGRLASFDAGTSGTMVLREGAAPVNRSTYNGSGNGKKALYGGSNNTDVDFARSSSAIDATEKSAGLFAYPFAKDTLALATAKVSNAPATIAPADMVKIYNGTYTNWSQVPGGVAGTIAPKIPQTGSGTRSFFVGELTKANGGTPVTLAGTVAEVQEHDATLIKSDPNAVAPFSIGRNAVDGDQLRIEGGFVAARALYNVVRQAQLSDAGILSIFGVDGFVCSPAAKPLIEKAGFEQLALPSKGGVCGQPTQDATSNLVTKEVATTTTLAGTSTSAGVATLTATVTAASAPDGLVSFFEGARLVGTSPLTGGKATKAVTGLTAGAHTFVAKYAPSANSAFAVSESAPVTVNVVAATPPPVVKASTKLVEKFKASYPKAASYKGKILVKETAVGAATGKIVVKLGTKTVGKGTVKAGKVVLKLKKLKKGKNKLTAVYAGDSKFVGSKLKFKIVIK
ncbi:Ig-like domain repeat protein [Nocardioides sp.]|uniref:Ig-like domain repeat protein n=1 Tax=Nocardioides sp. TaxID=35761 RepID=UPI002C3C61AF|nr:Ig-like domain repeat protein [Nocardioides sp.]HXH77596.1 Ig-like domain repeat protein [Nocardioides sp.]